MSLWSNTDANTSMPKFSGSLVRISNSQANNNLIYGNTTADAFITGQTIGMFGVSAGEKQGTGNLSSITVTAAGDSAYGLPTVTITGANTTPGTATLNVKAVGVTIVTPGTGYAVGNTFFIDAGANTTRGVLTVSSVDNNGNITGVNITNAGKYSTVTVANNNTFAVNTASGTGFTGNVRFGIESVTVNASGVGYNYSSVAVAFSANGIGNASAYITLTGQEGRNRGTHAGWVLRKVGSGGRAGRIQYETIVAMGSMSGDGSDDAEFASS